MLWSLNTVWKMSVRRQQHPKSGRVGHNKVQTPLSPPHPSPSPPPSPFDYLVPRSARTSDDAPRSAEQQLVDEGYKPLNAPMERPVDSKESLYSHGHPSDQTANAQAAYAYELTEQSKNDRTKFIPPVPFGKDSKKPKEVRKGQWKNHVFLFQLIRLICIMMI